MTEIVGLAVGCAVSSSPYGSCLCPMEPTPTVDDLLECNKYAVLLALYWTTTILGVLMVFLKKWQRIIIHHSIILSRAMERIRLSSVGAYIVAGPLRSSLHMTICTLIHTSTAVSYMQ
jgi:hypothetical protein